MMKKHVVAMLLASACVLTAGSAVAVNNNQADPTLVAAAAEEAGYATVYDFTTMTSFDELTDFKAGIDVYDRDEETLLEVDKDKYPGSQWETYPREMSSLFTLDNGLKVNTDNFLNEGANENKVYVRLDNKKLKYYKAELEYNYVDTVNGWAGLFFGWENFSRQVRYPDNMHGAEFFVQIEGYPTYSSYGMGVGEYYVDDSVSVWQKNGDHKMSLTVTPDEIVMEIDGEYATGVSKAEMDAAQFELISANMGFFFTNAEFTVKKFSYSPLNAQGEYVAVTGVDVNAPVTVEQSTSFTVVPTVSPANASLQDIGYELPTCASADGNTLTFAQTGTYTVKAYSIDNPAIYKEFTVTVADSGKYISYPTTAEEVKNGFEHYYVTNAGARDGAPAEITDYFTFNDDGSISLKEKKENAVDAGYSILYMKDLVNGSPIATNNFEISYMVKSSEYETKNGWHGVAFAMQTRMGVPNQVGASVFVQEEACKATVWGGGVNDYGVDGPHENASSYTRGQWNMVKVRVYGGGAAKVEMYVNDMTTPAITYNATNGIPAGDIGIFMTTNVTISNVSFAMLDQNGSLVEIIYPESVVVSNGVTTAKKGESLQLQTTVAPANVTDGSLVYESSNVTVAMVSDAGLISFLNAGNVTVTVSCKTNPAIKQVLEITVTEPDVKPTSVSFDAKPTNAKVGGSSVLFVTVGPENATDYSVTFTSSNTAVATVDAEGRLSYVGAGKTTITVSCNADPSVKASFELTVTDDSAADSASTEEKKGCGSSLGVSGVLATATALLALAGAKRISKKED